MSTMKKKLKKSLKELRKSIADAPCLDVEILTSVQKEVAEWSKTNFGDQESKIAHVERENQMGQLYKDPVPLGELAPLLGLIEENGELNEARNEQDWTKIHDALGDIFIYWCDFVARIHVSQEDGPEFHRTMMNAFDDTVVTLTTGVGKSCQPFRQLTISIGYLAHVMLKSHQGIRNFKDPQFRMTAIAKQIGVVLGTLCLACKDCEYEYHKDIGPNGELDFMPMRVLSDTWYEVSARDWIKNPVIAHEVANVLVNELPASKSVESAAAKGFTDAIEGR